VIKKTAILLTGLLLTFNVFANAESYQVVEGDRLAEILRIKEYGDAYRDLIPFIEETVRLNPDAFKDGNANHIIPGTTLLLPENPNKITVEEVVVVEPEPEILPEPEPEPIPEPIPELIGNLTVTTGRSEILRDNQRINVDDQQSLIAGDVIYTKQATVAEIELSDQSQFTLGPDSEFSIDEYSFLNSDTNNDTTFDTLITTIHRGALRVVTGLIGKIRENTYQVKSSLNVTIGIRGTDFTVRNCLEQALCGDLYGVSTAVEDGGIQFANAVSELALDKNQFTQIETASDIPESLPIPEGYFDLNLSPTEIKVSKSWFDRVVGWITDLF